MSRLYHVYILASRYRGTLYTGITSNLIGRCVVHREELLEGFTKKYGVKHLVYYEHHEDPYSAIVREKTIKRWRRAWKFSLIEERNPNWKDLFDGLANDLPFR